jgi:hypothetical protein
LSDIMAHQETTRPETRIYIRRTHGSDVQDELVGAIDSEGVIYRLGRGPRTPIGHVDSARRVFRATQFADREVGSFTAEGRVRSHGLFEGGELGWLERDGVVMQGGLILGEEEVGLVEGPNAEAGAAALLLIFLPDESEADKQAQR